jgi:hypothetical protein
MRNVLAVALAAGLALLPVKASAQEPLPYVDDAMHHASQAHGVSYRFMRCLAWRETNWLPWKSNGTLYHGLYQYDWSRWNHESPKYGFAGYSPYNAWAAAHVTAGVVANYTLAAVNGIWPPSRYCGSPWA